MGDEHHFRRKRASYGWRAEPTRSLKDVIGEDYDLILMAGGDVPEALLSNESLRRFLAGSRGTIAPVAHRQCRSDPPV